MTTSIVSQNQQGRDPVLPVDPRRSMQEECSYLAVLETVARRARTSNDPAEIAAAIQCFAEPSAVLRRLANRSRRYAP
jgi:hypothetical protein